MIDVTREIPMSLIVATIGIIFAVIGMGIYMVKQAKRQKEGA